MGTGNVQEQGTVRMRVGPCLVNSGENAFSRR